MSTWPPQPAVPVLTFQYFTRRCSALTRASDAAGAMAAASAARHDSRRQRGAMVVDLARPRKPDAIALRVLGDVLERLAQAAQAVGMAEDHGVQFDGADQRLLLREPEHLLELADDEVAELLRRVVAHQDLRAVVDLQRVRHQHDAA